MAQERSPQGQPETGPDAGAGHGQPNQPADRQPDQRTLTSPLEGEPLRPGSSSPELTLRAVVTGMVLGGLLSVCNVYVGLKVGQAFGMSIVAALAGYGFWRGLGGLVPGGVRHWGILENNINQTACSAGASVASAGLVAPIPALTLLTGQVLPWHWLALWVFSVMLVGIAVAIPLRRQLVVVDRLPFPVGIASAEMLKEMHARGAAALARLKALVSAGLVSVAATLFVTFRQLDPYALPFSITGFSARSLTMTLNPTLVPIGVGGLIGFRACCSLLVGAILAYGVLAPQLVRHNYIRVTVSAPLAELPVGVTFPLEEGGHARYDEEQELLSWAGVMGRAERDELLAGSVDPAYHEAVQALYERSQSAQPAYRQDLNPWLLWPGVTLMVVAALVSLCFSWRSIVAALSGWRASSEAQDSGSDDGGIRRTWFLLGLIGVLILSVALQVAFFEIAWWAAVAAVLLTFVLALVAARVAGETGVGTVGPMGKITQLVFGFLVPKNPVPNLMAANVTGGAASQCADLLEDLKCGHLLGAAPRRQTVAQVFGAVAGALVGSAAYLILIPNPREMLLTEEWAAPAAAIWKTVAELFVVGFDALPRGTSVAMGLAALAGVLLPVLERIAPRRLRPLVLSPVSMGLAFVLPAGIAFSMFIGGLAALLLRRYFEDWSARFLVAICVGLIAGESLTGMGTALVGLLMR